MKEYSRTEIEAAINEYIIGKNAQRDRRVIYRRLIDGLTYESLAEEFDLSVRQIKRIVYKCEDIIFRHI